MEPQEPGGAARAAESAGQVKASSRTAIDLMLAGQQARRMQQLSNELFTLADVIAGPCNSGEVSSRRAAKRQRIHCALLLENGLMEADGRPVGWTLEQDIAEEALALSELSIAGRTR